MITVANKRMRRLRHQAKPHLARARKLARLVRTRRYRHALWMGTAAAVEHQPLLLRLKPRTVIDVGANVGQFAIATRVAAPHCKVISFEPIPHAADAYERSMAGDPRTTLHRVALGAANETRAMHLSRRADSSSLLSVGPRQTDCFPGTEEVGTLDVPVRRLIDLVNPAELDSPVLLKIDVQGGEGLVLEGSKELLAHIDWVYIELSFEKLYEDQPTADEILRLLQSHGFTLHEIDHLSHDAERKPVQADFLFFNAAARPRPTG